MRRTNQNAADLCPFETLTLMFLQGEKSSAPMDLQEPHRVTHQCRECGEVGEQPSAFSTGRGTLFVPTFLSKYQSFASPLQVLDLLFMR